MHIDVKYSNASESMKKRKLTYFSCLVGVLYSVDLKGVVMRYIMVILVVVCFFGCENKGVQTTRIDSLESLKSFIKDGQEKGYFPKEILTGLPTFPKRLQPVDLENRTMLTWDMHARCEGSGKKIVLALDATNHSIVCDAGDVAYIAGDGDDWVDDAVDNDIFYMGKGDDTVHNSYGSDIFIFEENWGHDVIEFRPESVDTAQIKGYDGSYPWKYTSFIIFGKGIEREDIHWEGERLVHTKTGDSIKLSSREINILFANENSAKLKDKNFIPTKKVPQTIALEQIKGESLHIQNNTLFLANQGLLIIDVHDIKNPMLLSALHHLPGIATSVSIVGDIAYVTQAAPYFSEGAGGWVSIVDIKDLQNPTILSTLNFGNNIFSIATNGKYLYVADTNFSHKDQRALSIFDVSTPSEPKLVSKTKLHEYSRFMAYANGLLILSTFQDYVSIFDVENPKEPQKMAHTLAFDGRAVGLKMYHNTLLINQDKGALSLFEITKDKHIVPLCDAQTNPTNRYASNSPSAMTLHNGIIYKAQYQDGVSLIDMKNCQVLKTIPFDGVSIASVGVVGNTLIAMNKEKAFFHDLNAKQVSTKPSAQTDPYANLSKDQLQTLLYQAAQDDKANDVIALCKAGANPNFAGHERHTPVQISARLGKLNALKALLENGGRADGESMMFAALREQIEAMKLLEHYGGNIAQTDKDGCSTLHYIAQDGTVEMVRYLVEKGVPLNATCRGKESALKWANYGKNIEVIQYLESKGAR